MANPLLLMSESTALAKLSDEPILRPLWRYYGREFQGRAMHACAHENGVELLAIQPGKPTQNAFVESFNGRFRDECLNANWFANLAHAKVVIEQWRKEYNTERPKKSLGGRTPSEYAMHLQSNPV